MILCMMRNNYVKHILLIFWIFNSLCAYALKVDISRYSVTSGLSSNEINCIKHDRFNFIWFGTGNGLTRYDGYQFKTYFLNKISDDHSISNNIKFMDIDNDGNLWIVNDENKLFFLNVRFEEIQQISMEPFIKGRINALMISSDGDILLGTGNGLFKYNNSLKSFVFQKKISVKSLFEDSKKRIWVGTWSNGVYTFDLSTLDIVHYSLEENAKIDVTGFAEDKNGHVWVSTWDSHNLYCLLEPDNPYSTMIKRYSSDEKNKIIPDKVMYGVLYDKLHDDLWVYTANGILVISSPGEKDEMTYIDSFELGGSEVMSMCQDNDGLLWSSVLGTGIASIAYSEDLFQHKSFDAFLGKTVTALYQDEDYLWIGLRKELLNLMDIKEKKIYSYDEIKYLKNLREGANAVQAIVKESNSDNLWLGTRYGGIYVVEKKGKDIVGCEKIQSTPQGFSGRINTLAVDGETIWIGTIHGLFYLKVNEKDKTIVDFNKLNSIIQFDEILGLFSEENGLWVGTKSKGVFRIDHNGSIHEYNIFNGKLNSNSGSCFFRDSNGKLWLGTQGGGISYYNSNDDSFIISDDVQMFSDDFIYSILEDSDKHLWVTTGRGLFFINLHENQYVIWYNQKEKLQNMQFLNGASLCTKNNELLFGGYNGVDCFVKSNFEGREFKASNVCIVDVAVMNNSLSSMWRDEKKCSDFLPPYTTKIELSYNHNNISFNYSCLSYENPSANRYAYRLLGVDEEWIYTDSSKRYISYNTLKSGNYRFEVKACGVSGVWSDVKGINIKVNPAPWFTVWAYILYFIVFVVIVYLSISMVKRRIRLRHALLIEQIEHKKSDEVNQAKLKFFTNISHELFTPISVLQCSIDKQMIDGSGDPVLLKIMRANLQRLQRLLQQILEFRKVESGNLKLKVSYNDIVLFVRKLCKENFNPLVEAKQISLLFASDQDSIMGYFDVDKLDKILYNLLSNALKYNYQKGIISVSVSEKTISERRFVVLKVENTGDGIPESRMPYLFQRFYEGDYRKFKTHGTGIGLSLTKDLVNLHNGEIDVNSVPGETTVFTVTLPLDKDAYLDSQIDNLEVEKTSPAMELLTDNSEEEKYHVLIVEDDADLLMVISKVLSINFEVYTAMNGKEALDVLAISDRIDLVITDFVMPEMDGIALCKAIRGNELFSHLPVIMLTAKSQSEYQLEGLQSGADAYIAKPVEMGVLAAQIKTLLTNRKLIIDKFRHQEDTNTSELGLNESDQEFLNEAIAVVESNLEDSEFSNESFCSQINMSQSTLYRKLKSITGMSANEFIRNIRIKKACELLQTTNKSVADIAYMVGFNDPKYFGVIFKKEKGVSPSKYVEKLRNQ